MQSLKALAQSTLGEIKDALVDAVGDDDDEEDGHQSSRIPTPSPLNSFEQQATLKGEDSACASISGDSEADPCQHEQHEALKEFAELCELPGLKHSLQLLGASSEASQDLIQAISEKGSELSTAQVASWCCKVLRQALPRIALEAGSSHAPNETKRLLTSFNERYEKLLEEHMALQRRCRDLTSKNVQFEALAQQAEAWQSAHQAAICRVEQLSSENAELKEQMASLRRQGIESKERSLQQLLRQKDAELQASADALQKLEEVMEEQSALHEQNASLKRELREVQAARARASGGASAIAIAVGVPAPEPDSLAVDMSVLSSRCRAVEAELKETSAALEVCVRREGTQT